MNKIIKYLAIPVKEMIDNNIIIIIGINATLKK